MTILTPTFAESAKMHVTAPHEPTKEGDKPIIPMPLPLAGAPPERIEIKIGKKVALIGTAPSSKMLAPYGDKDWQIWGCSPGNMNQLSRVDLWFELHSNLLWPEYESYGKPYIEWLKQQKFPVFMQGFWPTLTGDLQPVQQIVPNAIPFPKDELVEEFGDEFFTSSFAWMMALAIKAGVQEIALYGIDMASRDEYIRQRPGFYYFKRKAMERGIKVSAPHESDIMQSPPLYAYSDSTPIGRKILARRQEINGRVGSMEQQHAQLGQNIHYLKGAQEDLDYFESIWSGVTNDMGKLQYENAKLRARNAELESVIAPFRRGEPVVIQPGQNFLMPGLWSMSNELRTSSEHVIDAPERASDEQPVRLDSGDIGNVHVQPDRRRVRLKRVRPNPDQANRAGADPDGASHHGTEPGVGSVQHATGTESLGHRSSVDPVGAGHSDLSDPRRNPDDSVGVDQVQQQPSA